MITHELAKIISAIRYHGDFYTMGRSEIVMPNLEIDGVGRIALPLLGVCRPNSSSELPLVRPMAAEKKRLSIPMCAALGRLMLATFI
jgi:hypothetical protein